MQTTMKGRSEKLYELPFWNKRFVTQYLAVTRFTVCPLCDVLSLDQSQDAFPLCQSKPCGRTFTSVVHFKFSDLPETVWEIPTLPPPTLSGSLWAMYIIIKYKIYWFATLIILLCRAVLAYLKCLKRYSCPAQCCWTWAVCCSLRHSYHCYC